MILHSFKLKPVFKFIREGSLKSFYEGQNGFSWKAQKKALWRIYYSPRIYDTSMDFKLLSTAENHLK